MAGRRAAEAYKRTYDPFVALAAAAAVTSTIRLGTGICMAVARDPIITAKAVASLDALSGGRFVFGVGYGWNAEEIEDHGVPFADRARVLREKVLAMTSIWSNDEAVFDAARLVRADVVVAEAGAAAPPARPHGVEGQRCQLPRHRRVLRRVDAHRALRQDGRHAPRATAGLRGGWPRPRRRNGLGDAPFVDHSALDQHALDRYASAGIARLILPLPSGRADEVLPVLDSYAPLVARYRA